MSGTETVLLDSATFKKPRTLRQKISVAEKITLKLSEQQLAKDLEGVDFFFVLTDFLEALKTEGFVSLAPDPGRATRPIVKLVQDNAKSVSKADFLREVQMYLTTRKVSWLDTDLVIFEWSDLHSISSTDVISKLQSAPISRAYIGMERDDEGTDYLTYNIRD